MKKRLRIVLVCQQDLGGDPHPVPSYRFWRSYLRHGLKEAGHEVVEIPDVDWAWGLVPQSKAEIEKWKNTTWEQAVCTIKREHRRQSIDLVLGYLYPIQILASAIDEIQGQGIPCVNFFCDNVREFRKVPSEFRPFDLHWVPELEACKMYRKAGLSHLHAPMPCWIEPQYRNIVSEEEFGPVFIGRRDRLRAHLLAEAIQLGLPVTIFGAGWTGSGPIANTKSGLKPTSISRKLINQFRLVQQHGFRSLCYKILPDRSGFTDKNFDYSSFSRPALDNSAYWHITKSAQICLGINRYPSPRHPHHAIKTYSRLRDIEAPMAGSCYLTEWADGIEFLYEPGREIEVYRTAAELVEKCDRLQAEPGTRTKLRVEAQRRALDHHSIGKTIDRIREKLGLE